jgi:hypothetical protein
MGAPGKIGSTQWDTSSSFRSNDAAKATSVNFTNATAAALSSSSSSSSSSSGSSSLETYLSLIPQYLAVLAVDNASFLAERCVAQYPASWEARYLWALCRYRSGEPGPALEVLSKSLPAPTSSCVEQSPLRDEQTKLHVLDSIRYLRAVCWFELEDYAGAERALLHECRRLYRIYREQSLQAYQTTGTHYQSENYIESSNGEYLSIDDWIVATTVCHS